MMILFSDHRRNVLGEESNEFTNSLNQSVKLELNDDEDNTRFVVLYKIIDLKDLTGAIYNPRHNKPKTEQTLDITNP